MITVAIAEVFFFVEFNPLVGLYRRRERPARRADAELRLGFTTLQLQHRLVDVRVPRVLVFRRHRDRAAHRALAGRRDLSAIRDNPLRAAGVGHNIHGYKLTAFVVAAAYAGFAGGLLGVLQGFMPPDAFTFDTSGQLVMQTAIGGAGTLFGPLVGATVWLYLSDFFQNTLHLGATWRLVLGLVFVLLVCFLRRGIIGGIDRSLRLADARGRRQPTATGEPVEPRRRRRAAHRRRSPASPPGGGERASRGRFSRRRVSPSATAASSPTATSISSSTTASCAASSARTAPARAPSSRCLPAKCRRRSGKIVFEGRDITGLSVTDVCQLGLTKSYQVNQLFARLTVRRKPDDRGAGRTARQIPARSVPQPRQRSRARRAGRADAGAGQSTATRRRAGIGARLWREAAAGNRTGAGDRRRSLLLLDEPLAGMSPRERVETVAAAQVDRAKAAR